MEAALFLCGLSIYVVFVFVHELDANADKNDSRNIIITYSISTWVIETFYTRSYLFDLYTSSKLTKEMLLLKLSLYLFPTVRCARC